METNKQNLWLYLIITLLVASNFTTVVLMSQSKPPFPGRSERFKSTPDEPLMSKALHKRLELTEQQIEITQPITMAYRNKLKDYKTKLTNERATMFEVLQEEQVDSIALHSSIENIGLLHIEMKKTTASYFLDFKKHLNPDQQEKFQYMFDRMARNQDFESHPAEKKRQRNRWGRESIDSNNPNCY